MMKTVSIQDIDVSNNQFFLASLVLFWHLLRDLCCLQNLQDEMMDLMDVSNEIQETLGRSYNVPDDIDEDELLGGKITAFQLSVDEIYGTLVILHCAYVLDYYRA